MNGKIVSGIILTLLIIILNLNSQSVRSEPNTRVYVDPLTSYAAVGETFSINVNIEDVADLRFWNGSIAFDSSVLQCVSVEEGPFLKQLADTGWVSTIDNTLGTINAYCGWGSGPPPIGGVSGSGTLEIITFQCISLGESVLGLYQPTNHELKHNWDLLNWPEYDYIVHTVEDGCFIAQLPPVNVTVNIDPDTLNLKSNGQWITAYITLSEGYSVEEIVADTVKIEDIPLAWSEIQDNVFMAKFDRAVVQGLTNEPDYEIETKFYELPLTVTGTLIDGTPFEGTDTIRVTY